MSNNTKAITISDGIDQYVQDLQLRHYSELTLYGYQKRLALFQQWAEERALGQAASITEAHLGRYPLFAPVHLRWQTDQGRNPKRALHGHQAIRSEEHTSELQTN